MGLDNIPSSLEHISVRPVRHFGTTFQYTFQAERVAQWLATCARKPKVSSSSPAATYVQR